MAEKKIVVPDGMLKAAVEAMREPSGPKFLYTEEWAFCALKAALLWLSENPIVPTEEQMISVRETVGQYPGNHRQYCAEWQRRMFLAPGPEVPEDIKDAIRSIAQGRTLTPAEADYIMDQVSRVAHGWTPKVSR